MNVSLETLVSLAKRRGFIYQGSEIYGGLSGTWDYGPLGVQLKRNIQNLWWKMFVEDRDDMYGVDTTILMNPKVWQASGHVDTFTDPMIECANCLNAFREDHIEGDKCPNCGKIGKFYKPQQFNMMFKTIAGPKYYSVDPKNDNEVLDLKGIPFKDRKTGKVIHEESINDPHGELNGFMLYDKHSLSYLRPETAQGMFVNFKNILDTFYPDLPFGVAQIGRVFRNEISPREFIFRVREFEIMELEYFIEEKDWEAQFEHWRQQFFAWVEAIGLDKKKIHELKVPKEDRAHYSKRTIDFEYEFSFGTKEIGAVAYRTNFDLKNHMEQSGTNMEYTVKGTNTKFIPHVIEPTWGLDRNLLAVLAEAYTEEVVEGEKRIVLKLPKHLAPVKVAVSPLLKNKPELVKKAREVYTTLQKEFGAVMWDDNGNIGKRYRRQDEIGTPYCVTVDFESLEDNSVTIRDRDTMEQERVKFNNLNDFLKGKL